MRPAHAILALLLAAASPAAPCPAAAPGEDPAKLRDQVLDSSFLEETRLKIARELEKADPEMLGEALLQLAEKKNAANLPFLVAFTIQETVRHLRLVATYAAWQSAPEKAAAAFLEKAEVEDDRQAIRAIEAAGLVAAVEKDRTPWPKLLEIAKGPRTFVGIEAVRAVNRSMDTKAQNDLVKAACAATDNHVRKHLVWAVLDLVANERSTTKVFEAMRARPGKEGKNANECVEILLDKNAISHVWNPAILKETPAWWKTGRPKGHKTDVAFGDKDTKAKVEGWFAELKKMAPLWDAYAGSAMPRMAFRLTKDPQVFDLKKKTLEIDAAEIARCETPWQGCYVLSRGAGISMTSQLGEPNTGHRGWEPAYVDLYGFMKATDHASGKFSDFVEESMAKKGWP